MVWAYLWLTVDLLSTKKCLIRFYILLKSMPLLMKLLLEVYDNE